MPQDLVTYCALAMHVFMQPIIQGETLVALEIVKVQYAETMKEVSIEILKNARRAQEHFKV